MYLYELALELGVRSTALLDRAHALGMNVDTTAQLTPEQVEQLREVYGRGRARQATPQPEVLTQMDAQGSSDGPLKPSAIIALVIAGLAVVLLVGYMVTNSDDSPSTTVALDGGEEESSSSTTTTTEPCDPDSGIGVGAIGQGEASTAGDTDATLPPCDVVGAISGDEDLGTTTTFDGDPLDVPRDKREFCKAALSLIDFEMELFEAADVESLGPIRDVMLAGRDKFKADLATMKETAPPRIGGPLERYGIIYTNLLDSVTPGADDLTLAVAFNTAARTDLAYDSNQIALAVNENCDKR
ncbi:MAG: hypothetical protein GX643_16740 [Acidimicrobiales bacterium]|nr:hypothetical protein [Acidimicrobiales bacterium]